MLISEAVPGPSGTGPARGDRRPPVRTSGLVCAAGRAAPRHNLVTRPCAEFGSMGSDAAYGGAYPTGSLIGAWPRDRTTTLRAALTGRARSRPAARPRPRLCTAAATTSVSNYTQFDTPHVPRHAHGRAHRECAAVREARPELASRPRRRKFVPYTLVESSCPKIFAQCGSPQVRCRLA